MLLPLRQEGASPLMSDSTLVFQGVLQLHQTFMCSRPTMAYLKSENNKKRHLFSPKSEPEFLFLLQPVSRRHSVPRTGPEDERSL